MLSSSSSRSTTSWTSGTVRTPLIALGLPTRRLPRRPSTRGPCAPPRRRARPCRSGGARRRLRIGRHCRPVPWRRSQTSTARPSARPTRWRLPWLPRASATWAATEGACDYRPVQPSLGDRFVACQTSQCIRMPHAGAWLRSRLAHAGAWLSSLLQLRSCARCSCLCNAVYVEASCSEGPPKRSKVDGTSSIRDHSHGSSKFARL
mmetsp:Transcript_13770/g.34622  ORF Transcript_13770/g.34622 Transcript_13770/m.34622 type:complete len:205 (-) Transcript_13770:1-615(-)